MFFGLGIRLAGIGTVVVAMYFFFVTESPIQGLRESLAWVVPVGLLFWIVAVGMFAAGAVARSSESDTDSFFSARMIAPVPTTRDAGSFRHLIGLVRLEAEKRFPSVFRFEWSLPLLRSLNKEEVLILASAYFREIGFRASPSDMTRAGLDVWLFEEGEEQPIGAVRCLARPSDPVGVEIVEKFHGMLTAHGIENGVIFTTGVFSDEAVTFSAGKALELMSGELFLTKLTALPEERSSELLRLVTRGGKVLAGRGQADFGKKSPVSSM